MQTSSEVLGTALVLQLAGLNQLPLPLADHETVHPLAWAAGGVHIENRKIAASAISVKRIARDRSAARSERVSPSMSILRCLRGPIRDVGRHNRACRCAA